MTSKGDIEVRVGNYLEATRERYRPGDDEYYARLALEQALLASREGNYGIGAVGVEVSGGLAREYHDRSAMVTGLGVVDHAETRALLRMKSGEAPDRVTPANFMEPGISVFGTLEPCPMCVCVLTNAGASRSVSAVLDGDLVLEDGVLTSDGSAMAIGRKALLQPRVWREIQNKQCLQFELLATPDEELPQLSRDVFMVGRDAIDDHVARRAGTGIQLSG